LIRLRVKLWRDKELGVEICPAAVVRLDQAAFTKFRRAMSYSVTSRQRLQFLRLTQPPLQLLAAERLPLQLAQLMHRKRLMM